MINFCMGKEGTMGKTAEHSEDDLRPPRSNRKVWYLVLQLKQWKWVMRSWRLTRSLFGQEMSVLIFCFHWTDVDGKTITCRLNVTMNDTPTRPVSTRSTPLDDITILLLGSWGDRRYGHAGKRKASQVTSSYMFIYKKFIRGTIISQTK